MTTHNMHPGRVLEASACDVLPLTPPQPAPSFPRTSAQVQPEQEMGYQWVANPIFSLIGFKLNVL